MNDRHELKTGVRTRRGPSGHHSLIEFSPVSLGQCYHTHCLFESGTDVPLAVSLTILQVQMLEILLITPRIMGLHVSRTGKTPIREHANTVILV